MITNDEYIRGVKTVSFNGRLWQRNYYEHIIRDDGSLNRIRQYRPDNPHPGCSTEKILQRQA